MSINKPQLIQTHAAIDCVSVTPADSDLPDGNCRSILVTGDGNLEIMTINGDVRGSIDVIAGMIIPLFAKQIRTATTATVFALY